MIHLPQFAARLPRHFNDTNFYWRRPQIKKLRRPAFSLWAAKTEAFGRPTSGRGAQPDNALAMVGTGPDDRVALRGPGQADDQTISRNPGIATPSVHPINRCLRLKRTSVRGRTGMRDVPTIQNGGSVSLRAAVRPRRAKLCDCQAERF